MAGGAILLLREEWRRSRQGKKIASKPLRGKVGERSDRIVAPDPPVKRPAWTRGHRQSAKESTGSDASRGDVTSPHQPALRCTSAPSTAERTRTAGRSCAWGNDHKAHSDAAEGASRR